MTPARRVACGALALLMAGLPFGLLLSGRSPSAPRWQGMADAPAAVRGITVSLLAAGTAPTELEGAQPPAVNSARLTDQTSRSPVEMPAATGISDSGSEGLGDGTSDAASDGDYLPVSQLTEWPRQRAPASPLADDDGPAGEVPLHAAWPAPKTVEAVLMIDEQGDVRRVRWTGDTLAPEERQWMEQRLRALRFVPGRLFGRAVRSRLTVELVLH